MKLNIYPILTQCVEEGILWGWRRFYKHRDDEPEYDEATLSELVDTMAYYVELAMEEHGFSFDTIDI